MLLDVDDIKQNLLSIAESDSSYESFLKPPEVRRLEEAGERFFPLELSALVHREASAVADRARHRALSNGLPVVIDGVLSDDERAAAWGEGA